MKKLFSMFFVAVIACFALVGCTHSPNKLPTVGNAGESYPDSIDTIPEQPSDDENTKQPPIIVQPEQEGITKMYLTVNGNKIEVTLAENSSVDALVEILEHGDITYTANDYGGFEKVGSLGHTLPTNNSQITTRAGDVILYSGNQIVLFYGSNTWSYTRLGKINGYSASELKTILGADNGNIQVTISLS